MGKKKLTEKKKKEIIAQKKKKAQEMQEIMKKLKNTNEQTQSLVKNLESVKDIHTDKRKIHKEHQQQKAKRKLSQQQKDKEQDNNDMELEEDSENESVEQQPQKKVKQDDQPVINIFQQSSFVNEEYEEVKNQEQKSQQQSKRDDHIRLENEAKKAFPDLNFNSFEGNKSKKIIEEELERERTLKGKPQEKEEIQYSDHEEIEDKQLKQLAKMYKKVDVEINRTEEIQAVRAKLPVYFKEQECVEIINNNLITILCGATGSGKSTQIPQFLLEAGYGHPQGQNPGMIGVTQPRRLAAVSLAQRVAEELNTKVGEEVIYQVRHEASDFNTEKSKIKFMTDGILMNEMASDFFLSKYSVIIIDEAHERKINTDLLLGLLSRLVNIRLRLALEKKGQFFPLRLVIMSATLRIEDFTKNKQLLPNPVNVINVEARMYPINIYFNKVTNPDYIDEAVKKCTQIHRKLPPGDVLVFLTGEREIKEFVVKLNFELDKYKRRQNKERTLETKDFELEDSEAEDNEEGDKKEEKDKNEEPSQNIIAHNPLESEKKGDEEEKIKISFQDYVVLPLYSKLSMEDQQKIFEKRENTRMFVISTNVAETSLTIPNIKYVVDTGKEKQKIFSEKLAISKHIVNWTSQASCGQRTGRAGRTSPGYCYRLYTPAVFGNIMPKFSDPEIMNTPLENVILHLKNIGIKDILQFPFPTRPSSENLRLSLQNLVKIKALELPLTKKDEEMRDQMHKLLEEEIAEDKTVINELGKVLSYIPLNPRYSKMLLQGKRAKLLGYTLLMVSFLSIEEIYNKEAFKPERKGDLINEDDFQENIQDEDQEDSHQKNIKEKLRMLQSMKEKQKEIMEMKKQEVANFKEKFETYFQGKSDIFVAMSILGDFVSYISKQDKFEQDQKIYEYAKENGLLSKALKEIYFNLNQLIEILDSLIQDEQEKKEQIKEFFENYKQPNNTQLNLLSEMIIGCFIDKVARKITYLDENEIKKTAYECTETNDKVYVNPKSFLSKTKPDYIAYTAITESKKKFMNNITQIDDIEWLHKYDYYNYRKVEYLDDPRPQFSKKRDQLQVKINYSYGKNQWTLPPFWGYYAEDCHNKYCHVARELMDGNILDFFKKYSKLNPQAIKPSNAKPEIKSVIDSLRNSQLDNKEKLLQKWKKNPEFLKKQIFYWLKPEFKDPIEKRWPPNL